MSYIPLSDLSKRVVYEDNHLIAINKRAGEIIQGDKTGDQPLSEAVKAFLKERDNKPGKVFLGVAHRLDRPVSGVCLFAKTSKALARVNKLFSTDAIEKKYVALVENKTKRAARRTAALFDKKRKAEQIVRPFQTCSRGQRSLVAIYVLGRKRKIPFGGSNARHRASPPNSLPVGGCRYAHKRRRKVRSSNPIKTAFPCISLAFIHPVRRLRFLGGAAPVFINPSD